MSSHRRLIEGSLIQIAPAAFFAIRADSLVYAKTELSPQAPPQIIDQRRKLRILGFERSQFLRMR